jgi:hypothetical protein
MFGTNFPQLPWEKFVKHVAGLGLKGEFLEGNARRVLKLGSRRVGKERL